MKKFFLHATLLFCVFLWTGCGRSKDLVQGLESYRDRNYSQAYTQLEPLAKSGKEAAQLTVGLMLLQGQGVPPDMAAASRWLDQVKSDRLENRYEKVVGEALADEMAYVLGQYRRGEFRGTSNVSGTPGDAGEGVAAAPGTEGSRFQSVYSYSNENNTAPQGGRNSVSSAPAPVPVNPDIPPPPP